MADRITSPSETAYLPPSPPPTNHGHTTAAWTMTVLVIIGFVIGAVGMVLALEPVLWAGIVITVLGLVVSKILQVMGHGQGGDKTRAKQERAAAEGRSH